MNSPYVHKARAAGIVLITWLLVACGGGDPTDTTGLRAANAAQPIATAAATPGDAIEASQREHRASILATALNADGPATELIVRAYGTLAGNVGPLMQVRVDGVVVGTTEVRAVESTDYRFAVPAIRAGNKVDVVFTNDQAINGVNRDLVVDYVIAGPTYVLPTSAGVVYDKGVGGGAFDGIDVLPGQGRMAWNGALRINWPAPNMIDTLTVRASGSLASNVGPLMRLRVNGIIVGSAEVRASEPTDYTFALPPLVAGVKIDVVFANDARVNGQDRNLAVHYLISGQTFMLPSAPSVVYDKGSGSAAFDGIDVKAGQIRISSNGALRFRWTPPNLTDRIVVRASGTLAGNVGPLMALRVDGITVGQVEVRTRELTDHSFSVPPLGPGSSVDLVFSNDATINGAERNLRVAYLIAGQTVVLPADPGVIYDIGSGTAAFNGANVVAGRSNMNAGGALRLNWPAPNMIDSITVRARASLADNVGALMQVLVDGVVVGTAEVKATDATDYSFATLPLVQGARVDVAFVNDATANAQDRNLYVNYVIAKRTFVVPTAAGVVYDRGSGTAAFDGNDTLPGQNAMNWNGALRISWPAPNITDALTLRASATLVGNVGALVNVRVNGVIVDRLEVRATVPTDYSIAVPRLVRGGKIDVVYANDVSTDGADRTLNVFYLLAGSTYMLPTSPGVVYDRGSGSGAIDGADILSGQSRMPGNGALRMTWPAPSITDTITVRASSTLAGNIGAVMQLRFNGVFLGSAEVRSADGADYVFAAPAPVAGSQIDLVYANDATIESADRNLFIYYIKAGALVLSSSAPGVLLDTGSGESAFDGASSTSGTGAVNHNGALRFTMPVVPATHTTLPAKFAAARLLHQATFGATIDEINRVVASGAAAWINDQISSPYSADYVSYVQGKYDLGPDYRPGGNKTDPSWVAQRFWATAATSHDQLRRRVAFSLHQMLTSSMFDPTVRYHSRAYANYMDMLHKHAFGNYRNLLEDMAMSPAMGIYLSHMRNPKEDLAVGRLPDENFARELMQLFSIGLYELNVDGSLRLDGGGKPMETYNNDDVMALAKVFTGRSWAFPDNQLTESQFLRGNPDYSITGDQRIDLLPMKIYPGQHSTAEMRLFANKPQAVVIAADTPPGDSLRIALDTLFKHPNVGPFVSRQLIQRLVTSAPSPAYVARVATIFNDNGNGVRGDLAAVVRAVLLDNEARSSPLAASFGKLRDPVLRLLQWVRAFDATSVSGAYMLAYELDNMAQRALSPPSVFSYTRPGYVPPNTAFAARGATAPNFQLVNESTTAAWVNKAEAMAGNGVGSTGSGIDVSSRYTTLAALAAAGNITGMQEHLNLLLFAGRMSADLRQALLDGVAGVSGTDSASHLNRARAAVFIALASPEYIAQR